MENRNCIHKIFKYTRCVGIRCTSGQKMISHKELTLRQKYRIKFLDLRLSFEEIEFQDLSNMFEFS